MIDDIYTEFLSKMSGWIDRDGQRHMILELTDWVNSGGSIAIQAPTGTGKSLAALLAAVESVRTDKGRIVIGTSTVILSEQYKDDIRDVEKAFGDIRFFVLKGASNYLCRNNAEAVLTRMRKGSPERKRKEREIGLYLIGKTDRIPEWAQANTESCVDCRREGSPQYYKCDYAQARAQALNSDVVVTSHAMIQCDLKVRKKDKSGVGLLGEIRGIIFDEAHQLSRMIYKETITYGKITKLDEQGILSRGMSATRKNDLMRHFSKLDDIKRTILDSGYAESSEQWAWLEPSSEVAQTVLDIWPTTAELVKMKFASEEKEDKKEASVCLTIVESLLNSAALLKRIADGKTDGSKAFYLTTNRYDGFSYHVRNMQADDWLLKSLEEFDVAYISATMGTHTHPTYVLDTLGIRSVDFVSVDSAFNYSEQMKWTWVDSATANKVNTLDWFRGITDGGTMALVTGHWTKSMMAEKLSDSGVNVYAQADSNVDSKHRVNKTTLENYKQAVRSGVGAVLVGTDSFATGLDLKRELLTKLFIDDIPAIREPSAYKHWKYRWLAVNGRDGRMDYEMPERAIVLEQQIGRLIRTEEDKGSVVISFDMNSEKGLKRDIVLEAMKRFEGAQWVEPTLLGS